MCIAGMNPRDVRGCRGNKYYKSPMHAAVEYPDLAVLKLEGGTTAAHGVERTESLLPGTKQVRGLAAEPNALSTAIAHRSKANGASTDCAEMILHARKACAI